MSTAQAGILWVADAAVGWELCCLNLADCGFNQLSEFLPLSFRNRSFQVLDFRLLFPNEGNDGDFRNATGPRVRGELRVKRKDVVRPFRIAAGSGLPVQNARGVIECPDGIEVGDEQLPLSRETNSCSESKRPGASPTLVPQGLHACKAISPYSSRWYRH